jgi:hypothetical protein
MMAAMVLGAEGAQIGTNLCGTLQSDFLLLCSQRSRCGFTYYCVRDEVHTWVVSCVTPLVRRLPGGLPYFVGSSNQVLCNDTVW